LSSRIHDLSFQYKEEETKRRFLLPESVSVYNVSIEGNVSIDEFTYINEGSRIDTGPNASIKIGKHCAIGRYVHITAKTHDFKRPTTNQFHKEILHKELDVRIGDYVWIGDKALILPGITIGDFAIVGANSVVTQNVKAFEVVGGVPARHLKFNVEHEKYSNRQE
jgi:acetyltransferase-like isoleucine patch superfamily enzyme